MVEGAARHRHLERAQRGRRDGLARLGVRPHADPHALRVKVTAGFRVFFRHRVERGPRGVRYGSLAPRVVSRRVVRRRHRVPQPHHVPGLVRGSAGRGWKREDGAPRSPAWGSDARRIERGASLAEVHERVRGDDGERLLGEDIRLLAMSGSRWRPSRGFVQPRRGDLLDATDDGRKVGVAEASARFRVAVPGRDAREAPERVGQVLGPERVPLVEDDAHQRAHVGRFVDVGVEPVRTRVSARRCGESPSDDDDGGRRGKRRAAGATHRGDARGGPVPPPAPGARTLARTLARVLARSPRRTHVASMSSSPRRPDVCNKRCGPRHVNNRELHLGIFLPPSPHNSRRPRSHELDDGEFPRRGIRDAVDVDAAIRRGASARRTAPRRARSASADPIR